MTPAFLLALSVHALAAPSLFVAPVDGKYGYIDAKGALVIKPTYDEAHSEREGFASVRVGDKWGFVRANGTSLLAPRFEAASSFFAGRAAVREGGKVGFIDAKGTLVIPAAYDGAENFADGRSLVRMGSEYGFIDAAGVVVIPVSLPWAASFSEGLAPVSKAGQAAGYLGLDGEMAIPEQYTQVGNFSEGLAAANPGGGFSYIDPTGKTVIPGPFEGAADFSQGRAIIKQDGTYGVIDRTGTVVVPPTFLAAGQYTEVGLVAAKSAEGIGFLNTAGELVIPHQFDDTHGFDGPLALVRKGLEWSYIDAKGATVWSPPRRKVQPAVATFFAGLEGKKIALAYYPFRVNGPVVADSLVGIYDSEAKAIAHARVHPEWEVVVPKPSGGVTHYAVYASSRDYLLRELTITMLPQPVVSQVVVVEPDAAAEEQFRNTMDALAACRLADAAMKMYLRDNAADAQAANNLPQIRRYEGAGGTPDIVKVTEYGL